MTSLLRASEESETRTLTRVGGLLVLSLVVATTLFVATKPLRHQSHGVISVAIETPYVGEGVTSGTPLIMHGVKVGEVNAISSHSGGGVLLKADLQSGSTTGLTDTMAIDFRPANYFGVTGINLIPANGGRPLQNGALITVTPTGNFTLQALLSRLGELSNNVVTPRLVSVLDRATRYTDALNPLLETMLITGTSLAKVQTISTEQLLRNATGISVAFPGYVNALVQTGDHYVHSKIGIGFNADEDYKNNPYVSTYDDALLNQYNAARKALESDPDGFTYGRVKDWLKGAETDLFSKIGNLESSHIYDLFPAVEEFRLIADVVPQLISPADIGDTLRELRSRLEHMYAGSGDQRALQVRIVLDSLPGVATPLGLVLGGPQ
ncbi:MULTISPECIES: Mammalian cell entry related domain protein [unclassified Mycobacterium]|uniref:Mammalian cell entry related domain protein n=1 Tax=unclassified Mycobacterium TaxID=2642494 RepID=UPI0029C8638B|nr:MULTISPECIES: Mammalian cell entry related domain protein [unclassified Mycobacterium]